MPHSNPSLPNDGHPEQLIALLLPDLVDCGAECEKLHKTFDEAAGEKRLLVCIADTNTPARQSFDALAGLAVETQFLIGHQIEKPQTDALVVKAPSDISRDDLIEFALALSDVVLVSAGNEDKQWAQYAGKKLGKTLVAVGSSLPRVSLDAVNVTTCLDPNTAGFHSWWRWLFGRPEQFILECLAFFSWGDGKKRKNRAWRSFWVWRVNAYFAPDECDGLCPDRAAGKNSALARCFDAMDRSALYGSYLHRDITWIAHLGVAAAVYCALGGYILGHHAVLSGLELFFLSLVLFWVLFARWVRLQDRWTACRLGAEQLRIMRMSLPLLVLPPAFATLDVEDPADAEDPVDFEFSALAQVKRAVRQQGLPRVDFGALTPSEAARWIRLIVADQMHYHEHNQHTLERAEKSLSIVSTALFVLSILAVLVFWGHDEPILLLLSAGGPALAAALHGAGTRLGFVHRAALSHEMQKQLKSIFHALDELARTAGSSEAAWRDVRAQTYEAAKAMGVENSSWHRLVRRYRDELP